MVVLVVAAPMVRLCKAQNMGQLDLQPPQEVQVVAAEVLPAIAMVMDQAAVAEDIMAVVQVVHQVA